MSVKVRGRTGSSVCDGAGRVLLVTECSWIDSLEDRSQIGMSRFAAPDASWQGIDRRRGIRCGGQKGSNTSASDSLRKRRERVKLSGVTFAVRR